MMLAAVTSPMAIQRRGEMISLNTTRAMREVATISKLLSREALAAVVRAMPSMSKMGAAMSSTIMAMV